MQGIAHRLMFVGVALVASDLPALAQPKVLQVHIVNREENKKELTAVIPALPDVKGSDKGTTEKSATDKGVAEKSETKLPETRKQTVTGATLTLRLPDGRGVKVSCESKYAFRMDYINRRDCRVPPADEVTAEFDGDEAKLIWPVSLDGRKTQSETYKILNILPAPRR
jgi:hypothetical protein